MTTSGAVLTVWATKPAGRPAAQLEAWGIVVRAIDEEDRRLDLYVLAPQLVVERRTRMSFLQGIQDKSLFLSAITLRERFSTPILILEGTIDYDRTGFSPQAVRGALSAMVLEYGLNVLATRDSNETAHLLAMMARHAQIGVPEISLVPKRKAVDLPDLQRRVAEMLPGCGRVMARDLLQYFGSIERIVAASDLDLSRVRGIGKKRAAEIHRVLHAEYRAVDSERHLEDAIAADPALLFDAKVELLARQHVITASGGDRHVVDLVFYNPARDVLMLVELKYGALEVAHEAQLGRYLDIVNQSPLLSTYLDRGAAVRGILATVTESHYGPRRAEIEVAVVDEVAVIDALARLRQHHWGVESQDT